MEEVGLLSMREIQVIHFCDKMTISPPQEVIFSPYLMDTQLALPLNGHVLK